MSLTDSGFFVIIICTGKILLNRPFHRVFSHAKNRHENEQVNVSHDFVDFAVYRLQLLCRVNWISLVLRVHDHRMKVEVDRASSESHSNQRFKLDLEMSCISVLVIQNHVLTT